MSAAEHAVPSFAAAVDAACASIAPTWPLDRFIAVNPYWGWIDKPFADAGAQLARLSGAHFWMPRQFYRDAWSRGEVRPEHLTQAVDACVGAHDVESCLRWLKASLELIAQPAPLLSDIVDEERDLTHAPSWRDTITHQISQFCGAYFDQDQADWRAAHGERGLYAAWRDAMIHDHSIALLMGAPSVAKRARGLPRTADRLLSGALTSWRIEPTESADLLRAALLRINGWAAWCAYLRWQARLDGREDDHIVELLAIRVAWELLLDDERRGPDSAWARWRGAWQARLHAHEDWSMYAVWSRALEIAYQDDLARALVSPPLAGGHERASIQAVFCIDVRSEVFRRALEAADSSVQTLGFAGFFGLPISYAPLGAAVAWPQLPGLLAPSMRATDSSGDAREDQAIAQARRSRLAAAREARAFEVAPAAAFPRVETVGLAYLPTLIARSISFTGRSAAVENEALKHAERRVLRPQLIWEGASIGARAEAAERVLKAMSLTSEFAPFVLLIGHGGETANNPHAAGLDCGACGGQTGEVNARALASLLNEQGVREELRGRGIDIPAATVFIAGLHNTTTDEVRLFAEDLPEATHSSEVQAIQHTLHLAGDTARAERAAHLGLSELTHDPGRLLHAYRTRAKDWSQTRPEWGLANNAAFIVAPRARTRGVDLQGRTFLHEYDAQRDADGAVLELIMTAPMIVTHWINMQYYASTVDNQRYGSGNKVLHNVVGGRIGVFEGNGGDLRIGLPWQSVHDGERWRHTPLRLSVFIEAPRAAIEAVLAKHALVRSLIENEWLFLFRIDAHARVVEAYARGAWRVGAADC